MHYGHLEYSIEPCGEGWQVSFCHSPHGRFHRRLDALRSAFADAERVTRLGQAVRLKVERPRHAAGLPARIVTPAPAASGPGRAMG